MTGIRSCRGPVSSSPTSTPLQRLPLLPNKPRTVRQKVQRYNRDSIWFLPIRYRSDHGNGIVGGNEDWNGHLRPQGIMEIESRNSGGRLGGCMEPILVKSYPVRSFLQDCRMPVGAVPALEEHGGVYWGTWGGRGIGILFSGLLSGVRIEAKSGSGVLYRHYQISRIVRNLVDQRRHRPHLHQVSGVRLEHLLQAGGICRSSLQPRLIFVGG